MTSHESPSEEPDPLDRELAKRLVSERPVPAAQFRAVLGRHLAARDPGYGPRPARLLTTVATYLGAGCVIGVLGALIAAGVL
jgi:hypothetical protein